MNSSTLVGFAILSGTIPLSKVVKEHICIKLNGKDEFKNLDIDIIARCVIYLLLVAIEVALYSGIVSLITGET